MSETLRQPDHEILEPTCVLGDDAAACSPKGSVWAMAGRWREARLTPIGATMANSEADGSILAQVNVDDGTYCLDSFRAVGLNF